MMFEPATERDLQRFEAEQAGYQKGISALLTEGLDPSRSDEDFDELKEKTVIAETVHHVGGDERDARNMITEIYAAVDWYRNLYGRDPDPGQLAMIGSALTAFTEWDTLKNMKTDAKGNGQIIAEAVDDVGTSTENIHIVPQFMTIAALIPLVTIAPQLCHSIGAPLAVDKVTVYELFEMVGYNPYGITEGSDINGLYDGELSNAGRITAADETPNGTDVVTFTLEPAFPITKKKVFLYINRRRIGIDNGNGAFMIPGSNEIDDSGTTVSISDSTITYWNGSDAAGISVTFSAPIPAGVPVWFGTETDVENYPEYVSETKYETRGFDLYSTANIIRTGLTLQSVLRTMRNHKMQLKDIAFSRLLQIIAADYDRETLRRIIMFADGGAETFDMKLRDGVPAYEQWARAKEPMIDLSYDMAANTDGRANINAFLIDDNFKRFFRKLGSPYVNLAPTADNPELANQPHYFGEFEGFRLFYCPLNSANKAYGIGKGKRISECVAVLGNVTPPLPHQHGVQTDLAKRCTLYKESINDQPPLAYKYATTLTLTDTT